MCIKVIGWDNVVGVLTSSQDVLNSNERYRVYKDVARSFWYI